MLHDNEKVVVFRISNLHTRSVQQAGLTIRVDQREVFTGPITSCLDETATASNLALIDFSSGRMAIKWNTIVTFPLLADLHSTLGFARGESGVVRTAFEESGTINGDGFAVSGPGQVLPGSFFSNCAVASQNNGHVQGSLCPCELPSGHSDHRAGLEAYWRQLVEDGGLAFKFCPENSVVDVTFPKSLGASQQQFNLEGTFHLEPVLTLPELKSLRSQAAQMLQHE